MLDLKRQYLPLHKSCSKPGHVLETQQFILGEPVAAFEKAAATQLGVAHAVGALQEPMRCGWRWRPRASAWRCMITTVQFLRFVSAILRAGQRLFWQISIRRRSIWIQQRRKQCLPVRMGRKCARSCR